MEAEQKNSTTCNLDTARADRSVWLMKCPLVVSKSWSSAPNNQPLSKVVVSLDPLRQEDPSSLQFTMEMAGSETGNMPKSYSLNMSKDFVPMSVFSEVNQGKVAMEGKVEHKFDMKPHNENMEDYGKMCRERTNKSMIKHRQIQVIDKMNTLPLPMPMPVVVGLDNNNNNKKKVPPAPVKGSDMKRTRRDRGEMQDIMFKLFERQANWTLKQLVQQTDQPAQFLKEILGDICNYNKRGSNLGSYELKPEYKKTVEDADAE